MAPAEKRVRLLEAAAALLDGSPGHQLKTVALNKALFYLDLATLRDSGETVTGNTYLAIEKGPVIAKYQKRLIKALCDSGIAKQDEEGRSKPVTLLNLPQFTAISPAAIAKAVEVSRWCTGKVAGNLSDISHKNLGWIIAFEGTKAAGGVGQPIDMNIAMQQILEADPWMVEPLDEAVRATCDVDDAIGDISW